MKICYRNEENRQLIEVGEQNTTLIIRIFRHTVGTLLSNAGRKGSDTDCSIVVLLAVKLTQAIQELGRLYLSCNWRSFIHHVDNSPILELGSIRTIKRNQLKGLLRHIRP